MSIEKVGDKYKLDFYPNGRAGKRIVKVFKTRKAAFQYEKDTLSGKLNQVQKTDNKQLTDYIHLWHDLHGRSLKSGVDTRNRLLKLSQALNNPVFSTLSVSDLANYRKQRLEQGITESTLNRELTTLKAMYRELKRMGVITFDLSLSLLSIRKLKQQNSELQYLTTEQITKLLKEVENSTNESLFYVVKIALVTGARWSECEKLTIDKLQNGGFYFTDTKNGLSRFVPVSENIYQLIEVRLKQSSFKSCYSAFRSAYARTGFDSRGQCAHILRHTFASHFVMYGGNLTALKQILGHSSVTVTEKYSHLASDYLSQAVKFNPLENMV
jgi:site-specific recombinase XerD